MKIVIIGGGVAGVTAAETIRMLNKECEIILISEEEPFYSPCIFPQCLSNELDVNRIFLKKVDDLQRENINFLKQKAVKIDKKQKKIYLSNGAIINFDKLILSTGSRQAIPPIDGIKKDGVFTFKSFDDFIKIHEIAQKKNGNVVIIGGGVVGVEVAYALKRIGWNVYLIEFFDRILPRLLDPEPALILKDIMETNGIHVFTSEKVERIIGAERKIDAIITNKRKINCDIVILATGMYPRTELAKEAGIELGQFGGIKVNPYMMTSANDIYACGDCVETEDLSSGKSKPSMLWHVAKLQGYIAAHNCIGIQKKFPGALNLTIIKIFETYIISNANTLADFKEEETKIMEKKDEENYLRTILINNRVASVQFVGKNLEAEEFGLMFGIMRKAKQSEILPKVTEKEEIIQRIYPLLLCFPYLKPEEFQFSKTK